MKLVIIESPYAGDIERNVKYARDCLRDSLNRGEAPLASHLLYTQALSDDVERERNLGIDAGLSWLKVADVSCIYVDFGISEGMKQGIAEAKKLNVKIEYRRLYNEVDDCV